MPSSYTWLILLCILYKLTTWIHEVQVKFKSHIKINKAICLLKPCYSYKFRSTTEAFATKVAALAQSLAEILAQKLNMESNYFRENCLPYSNYLRLNRYPACPFPSKVFGLLPHSDSSFLTIVYQDQVGGLQLLKDGKWIDIKPNPQALIVNIGDLFQVTFHSI